MNFWLLNQDYVPLWSQQRIHDDRKCLTNTVPNINQIRVRTY